MIPERLPAQRRIAAANAIDAAQHDARLAQQYAEPEPARYLGRDEHGTEYLLTVWDSRHAELATRPLTGGTWGPPLPLLSDRIGAEA